MRGKLRTISYFAVFALLSPVGLGAQIALPAAQVPAQAVIYDRSGQTPLGYAWGTVPAKGLLSSLLCPPINPMNSLNQWLDTGSSYRSGTAFRLGLHDTSGYLLGGVQPMPGEQIVSGSRLPRDLDSKDYTSTAMTRADTPGLDGLHSRSEKRDDMAFLKVASQSGSGGHAEHGKVALVILSLAVHAAVTWDARSTNHFFHHYPEGYRPTEVDPLMRPFVGKALMYPMANLFFAAPIDLLLLKTHNSQKPIRILTYTAASVWVGMEIRQSIVNMGNEHINSAPAIEPGEAIARVK